MKLSLVRAALASSLLLLPAGFAACSSAGHDEEFGSAEQATTADDLALAKQILAMVGGPQGKCVQCHAAAPADVKRWGTAMQAVDAACIAPANLTASQRVACLRDATGFTAHKLGLYAAGATLPQFSTVFQGAFPTDASQFKTFTQQVGMPKVGAPFSANDFATIKGWVLRGMPQLDNASRPDAGTDSGTAACTDSVTPELAAHLATMKTSGWGARLADQRTPMFGCGVATSALGCLGTLPDITATVTAKGVTQTVRQLRSLPFHSHWWVRSSADGRYLGFGVTPTSKIVDLTTAPTAPAIDVSAPYDPFFFPSNDGFAYAGATGGIVACKQSILAGATHISLTEPGCGSVGGNAVYESIGASLDGSRYFVTTGDHQNDDGGNVVTHPLSGTFGAGASTAFVPMINDGTTYRPQAAVNVTMPGEGDLMLSPSSLLAATRFGTSGGSKQAGYRVHLVKATVSGGATSIKVPVGAEVCMKGGKPTFSFDERFVAAHQYVDQTEPDQSTLADGSSNIVVADLKTGNHVRITLMKARQFALYPHFRADGWLYFLVRDMAAGVEYVAATDAVIRLAAAHP